MTKPKEDTEVLSEHDTCDENDAKPAAPVPAPTRKEQVRAAWSALPGSILQSILRDVNP